MAMTTFTKCCHEDYKPRPEKWVFRLWGRAPWENIDIEEEDLKSAKIGDSWEATSWNETEQATVVGKHVDGVTARVRVRFDWTSAWNGRSGTYFMEYDV